MNTLLFQLSNQAIQTIGYVGTFLTSVTFIPQVIKSWQSKSVGDLSVLMVLIVIISTIVWLIYGFGIDNGGPVIVANFVVLILSLVLLYFKFTFKK
ncbi:MAG: PQ-loop repeat-containing protein [Bacteroidetes bacterium]|nr:PQ-loop repeat-containing protein [Bacteroidota bacterium]MBS1591424.1 PQ-loop repeat-containing protein [Bacteroidota bacterium]MBS1640216.1 PQ-loop repeat-containing protein [Bacteroidota bacterium]MBS1641120.1 PQ-loop repeat-containing protein [Bacteroidota bacterium]MBS1670790.1 PQ-loop repeat-containing protein [Bacteroidota bacterium]